MRIMHHSGGSIEGKWQIHLADKRGRKFILSHSNSCLTLRRDFNLWGKPFDPTVYHKKVWEWHWDEESKQFGRTRRWAWEAPVHFTRRFLKQEGRS